MNYMQSDQPAPIHRQTLDVGANPGRRKILALVIASAFLPSLAHAASHARVLNYLPMDSTLPY